MAEAAVARSPISLTHSGLNVDTSLVDKSSCVQFEARCAGNLRAKRINLCLRKLRNSTNDTL